MIRRSKYALIGLLAFVMLAQITVQPGKPARAQMATKKPNILIILTDDQRAGAESMSMMPRTKALFGKHGVFYSNAIATTPQCCPSRASIFSGKYSHNHNVRNNSQAGNFDAHDSLQRLLSENGYQSAISGKYLNLQLADPPFFDHWAITSQSEDYYDAKANVNGTPRTIHRYIMDFIRKKSVEFLKGFEQRDRKPWFLLVTPHAPHPPAIPEPRYQGTRYPRWKGNPATTEEHLGDKPEYVRELHATKRKVGNLRRRMLWSLKSADDMVARIFKVLANQHEKRDTLALFLSDNGYMWYEHGIEAKRTPYDSSVRIPFYARWPEHLSPGIKETKLVANIDVAPTIYEATGIVPDYPVDGRSIFSPFVRDNILIEFYFDPVQASKAIPDWQGIWSPGSSYVEYETGEKEYYDDADKWELNNRLMNANQNDDPSNQPQLHALLEAYKSCVGPSCP